MYLAPKCQPKLLIISNKQDFDGLGVCSLAAKVNEISRCVKVPLSQSSVFYVVYVET